MRSFIEFPTLILLPFMSLFFLTTLIQKYFSYLLYFPYSMSLHTLNSPRPLDIEEALAQCFGNQTSEPFNLSVSGNDIPSEEAVKINGMKRKMLLSELKSMILQLVEMLRGHNNGVRKEILQYEAEMIVCSQSLATAFLTAMESREAQRSGLMQKTCASTKINQQEYSPRCSCNNHQDIIKYTQQIQTQRHEISKYQTQLSVLKKQNYKVYQDNFSLEQKVKDLENQLEVKNHQLIRKNAAMQKEKQEFEQTMRRLQHLIREKDARIEYLENLIRKQKKNGVGRDEDEKASSTGNRNISEDQVISFDNPLDKGFCSEQTSQYRTCTNTQTKESYILPKSANKRLELPTKLESRLASPRREEERKVQYDALTSNRSRNRKSLSKEKFNFQKIGMQLENLTYELEKDLRRINHRIR